MKNLIGISVVALALLFMSSAEPVQAQNCGGIGGFGTGYGIGLGGFGFSRPYMSGRVPTPPYFALHPPVYYSQPVARTYGYSPFAYPGTVTTPEAKPAQAKMITNPHATPVKGDAGEKKVDMNLTVRSEPKEILNPFVTSNQLAKN